MSEGDESSPPKKDHLGRRFWIALIAWLVFTWLYYFLLIDRNNGSSYGWLSADTVSLIIAIFGTFATVLVAYWTVRLARMGTSSTSVVVMFAIATVTNAIYTFAVVYYRFGLDDNWTVKLTRLDALFVAAGTLTSGGTGDIQPRSEVARGLLLGEMGVGIIAFTAVIAIVIERMTRTSAHRRS